MKGFVHQAAIVTIILVITELILALRYYSFLAAT